MHAFIGTVPFTIFEAVHFVITNNIQDADLYVVKVFNNAESVGKRLDETGVFRNVFIVDDVLLTYPITLKKCLSVLKNSRILLKMLAKKKYEAVYYNNSGWLINSIFYTGCYKGNKNVKNIFLEHGYYSYTQDYMDKPWYLRSLIKGVGLKCMDGSMLDELYLFHPELMTVESHCIIKKMPPIDTENRRFVEALNYAFDYDINNNEYETKDIVIIEQGPQKYDFDKEKFWNDILKNLDLERTIIKPHPRQKNSSLQNCGCQISKNFTIPWEVEILNSEIQNKIQLTIFSGACISPKLLFDKVPIVILLYKLLPVDSSLWGQGMLDFSDRVGAIYRDKDRYFVPETMEELRRFFEKNGMERKDS